MSLFTLLVNFIPPPNWGAYSRGRGHSFVCRGEGDDPRSPKPLKRSDREILPPIDNSASSICHFHFGSCWMRVEWVVGHQTAVNTTLFRSRLECSLPFMNGEYICRSKRRHELALKVPRIEGKRFFNLQQNRLRFTKSPHLSRIYHTHEV